MQTIEDRFWAKVERQGPEDCWLWTGGQTKRGYGIFYPVRDQHEGSHRVAYRISIGPIPEGLEIDHLCRTKLCCNPTHLEPVTHIENVRRHFRLQTHCKNGHELSDQNTYIRKEGQRQCRECKRIRMQNLRDRTH